MAKKYNPEYIAGVTERISNVLNDKRERSDWTQISISIQDAVQAAANIYGNFTDEQKHNLYGFFRELCLTSVNNIIKYGAIYKEGQK